ncbi:MAG TPA: thioredoxin family protein [Aliidongia sp.]|uniref:thioredoxin family protein n=1 Tax=Aliidongia sp. TaxID=1914230 RepID=UPI002DDCAEFD|nr:thioredoxin family protein [Aliidongia sp.]HEV2677987.1 thioredoxin family protein [Aliidongia sp.]
MERSIGMICAAMAALTLGGTALAASQQAAAPVITVDRVQAMARPYDEAADAHQSLAAALAAAKASGKKVLVDFGANWCPDCRALGGIMSVDKVQAYVAAHYEVAVIDVGRFNKNLDIAAAYGVKIHGIPTVMVIDPASNQVLNRDGLEALGDAGTMPAQAVVDQLVTWTERPAS